VNEAVNVARRGYEIKGDLTTQLNTFTRDDTGEIYASINRYRYPEVGKHIVERGRTGKALYAIKGKVMKPGTMLMISVHMVRYIGDLDD